MPISQICEGFEKAKSIIIRGLLLAASLTYLIQDWRRVAMGDKASGKLYPNGEDRLRVFLHLIYEDDARPDPDTKRLLPRHLAQRATEIWAFGLRLFLLHHFPFVYHTLVGVVATIFAVLAMLWTRTMTSPPYCSNNRLARTQKSYMLLATPMIEPEDTVMLVQGARVPLIMRQRGDTWELIGHAYVPGMMYGEQWDEMKCEEIVICLTSLPIMPERSY
jgi:hypothetical protein